MTMKMTLSIYDDMHQQTARGLAYDLWRIHSSTNRTQIKHDRISDHDQDLLIESDDESQMGSYELVLYTNDYFEQFTDVDALCTARFIVPFGFNQEQHLNIHIQPSSYTCTL